MTDSDRRKAEPGRRSTNQRSTASVASQADPAGSPIGRVFTVLAEITRHRGAISISDLSRALHLPKTTVHRMVRQFEGLGYLQREPMSRRMEISPALVDLAADLVAASTRLAPRHVALQELSRKIGESCSLGTRVGYEIVYLHDVTAPGPLTFHFQAGRRAPLHCTSIGKLFLADMSEAELNRYLASAPLTRFTDYTICDPQRLKEVIAQATDAGFVCSNQEYVLGVVGTAVPLLRPDGRLFAGLAASIPAPRMNYDDLPYLVPVLQDTAAKLMAMFIEEHRADVESQVGG